MIIAIQQIDLVMVGAIVVLLLASAFLALAETSLTRVSKVRVRVLEEEGRPGARALGRLIRRPEEFINPILLVILVLQTVQTALTTIVCDRLFGGAGVAVGLFINVVVVFVLAEAAPKTWAVQHTDKAALLAARPVRMVVRLAPLRLLSRALIGLTNVILPGKGLKQGPFVSEEEFLAMADEAVEAEVIEAEEQVLIRQIIEFGDTVVREVMVPRPDMVTVGADYRVDAVMEIVLLNGYSRIPVVGESIDDVVGLIYAKDLMRAERDGFADHEVQKLMRPAHFVPESKRVTELLREMQAESFHMAVVIDEYGGTAGVVTLEDLIEELVGEIVDEYDNEDPSVEPLPGGDLRVNARLSIDDANDLLVTAERPDVQLPSGDWDTVGGLIFSTLGRVAAVGDKVEVPGYLLTVDRMQGRRIVRVRITRLEPPDRLTYRDDDEDDDR
jgi:CBS domain containing-hemolysin-like protein